MYKTFTLLTLVLLFAPAGMAQQPAPDFSCLPTCSETDGKMLSLAGSGLVTLGGDTIGIRLVSEGDGFQFSLFDGDTIGGGAASGFQGHWDRVGGGEFNLTQLKYQLFADPDGDGSGDFEVGPSGGWFSNENNPSNGTFYTSSVHGVETGIMPDNSWFDVDITNAAEAAANPNSDCASGTYCYLLTVELTNPNGSTESNFKVRSTAGMSIRPLAFSFVGALRSPNDAAIIYPRFGAGQDLSLTTYDGEWRFVASVDEPITFFSLWDGDFDFGSYDCTDQDTDDPDTCLSVPVNDLSNPESCFPNTHPNQVGALVPSWAVGTDAAEEGIAQGTVRPCGNTTGSPNDNQDPLLLPALPNFFVRGGSVTYALETPVGTFANPNPSGNQEWEQFRLETDNTVPADFHVASLPAGDYVLNLSGLDAANLNALRVSLDVKGTPSASIGDRVWLDRNADGVQDAIEPGLNNVEVRLYWDANGNNTLDESTDRLMATQFTNGDGDYDFRGIGAGNYFVDVLDSSLPAQLVLTTANEPYLPGGPYPLQETEDHNDADFGYFLDCGETSTNQSGFNGTDISGGHYIWFNAIVKAGGFGDGPTTLRFNSTITSPEFDLVPPKAVIRYSPTATQASTSFDAATNTWETVVPPALFDKNIFLSGLPYFVPAGLEGGLSPVTWEGILVSDTPGTKASWKWAAAVYTNFSEDPGMLGVKPVDGDKYNPYKNSDHAGVPENFKAFVIGGARGGGGSNWTGSYSGTKKFSICVLPNN